MDIGRRIVQANDRLRLKSDARHHVGLIACAALLILAFGALDARADWPRIVPSKDGTPISYEVFGEGEPALVFVHGWSCDSRYWREQVPALSKKHRVVVLDLAGHGHSGMARKRYTMKAFGEDVKAVTEAAGCRSAILIGHSMGGSVIPEAARLMPERVAGLIGIDTLQNVEHVMTRKDLKKMIAPLKKNFQTGTRQFVKRMVSPQTDPKLGEWILADMSAAPAAVALSAMNELIMRYVTGEEARVFDQVRIPVVTVNGDLGGPINYEANRRHMLSYDAIVLKGADHFLMMALPEEFNTALEKAIQMVSTKAVK